MVSPLAIENIFRNNEISSILNSAVEFEIPTRTNCHRVMHSLINKD